MAVFCDHVEKTQTWTYLSLHRHRDTHWSAPNPLPSVVEVEPFTKVRRIWLVCVTFTMNPNKKSWSCHNLRKPRPATTCQGKPVRAMPLCTDRKLEHTSHGVLPQIGDSSLKKRTFQCNLGNSVFVAKRRSVASGLQGYSQSVEAPCVMLPTGGPQSGTRPPENWEERQSS